MLKKIRKIASNTKSRISRFITYLLSFSRRKKLNNYTFSIISNNCWGGSVYRRFNLQYKSPFLGLFIPAPCYIELLENLEENMKLPLKFISIEQSRYYSKIMKDGRKYPIALLGKTIEIHFLHYPTPEKALQKWEQRKQRINYQNLFIKFSEMDCCSAQLVERFDKLPFKYKICFAVNSYPHLSSVYPYPHRKGDLEVRNDSKFFPAVVLKILNECGNKNG